MTCQTSQNSLKLEITYAEKWILSFTKTKMCEGSKIGVVRGNNLNEET